MDPNYILGQCIDALRNAVAQLEGIRNTPNLGGGAGPALNIAPPTEYHQQTIDNQQKMIEQQAKTIESLSNRIAQAQANGIVI